MFSSSVVYALLTASLFGRAEGFMASSSSTVSSCGVETGRHAPCRNSGVSSWTDRNRIRVMMAGGASTDDDRDRSARVSGGGRDSWGSGNRCSSNSSRKQRKRRTKTRLGGDGGGAGGGGASGSRKVEHPGGGARSVALRSSACPAGDESAAGGAGSGGAGAWKRNLSADEDKRLKAEWLVGDSGPSSAPVQPWELRSLTADEQLSHLNRGLLQLSATFGWCVTDAEAVELDGFNRRVLEDASYLSPDEQNWIGVAVQVAYHAHQGQRRKSGEPFIMHPVEVMGILAGLRMDAETLVAALLHDTVEDTRLAFEDIETQFGSTVRRIVEGETKLSKIPGRVSAFTASDYEMGGSTAQQRAEGAKQADNLRHMLIAMSKDWRVLVVKLSDRLHNMRTLGAMPQHKQVRIAQETMGVFVPLARRMGLWDIKTELEDMCFKTLHPEEHARVTELLRLRSASTGHTKEFLESEQRRLERVLGRTAVLEGRARSFRVTMGVKPAYTVWRSMARNGGRLGSVLDCVHFKVSFSLHPKPGPDGVVRSSFENSERERAACYGLLESLHGLLPPVSPPRVEDFIAVPKPNNYRALHTAVLLKGHPVEVQILTDDMDRVAHFGMAASQVARSSGNPKNLPWLAELQTSAEACALGCGDTYSANVRDSLTRAQERRFVFDPQGKILDLAGNATMRDAARELHDSKTCRVAATYVNGRLVPLNRPLRNGDVVAILTAPFLPTKPPTAAAVAAAAAEVETTPTMESERPAVDAPLHVHTGVWPLNMGAMPMTQRSGEEPELLMEIDEIPFMTKGEKRLAREVELQHARLSMFAVLAWMAVEMERISGLAMLKPDALAALHESPFAYLSSLSPQQALRVVMVMSVLEGGFLVYNSLQDRFERSEAIRPDKKVALTAQEKAMQDRRKFHARERELHNGRLAMIAIVCLSVQSALAGEDSLARLFGLF
ncbi:unnamed protein product [Ectocarpus sp. 4 AP-2014]